jgi:uncharacterized protein with PIN domain
MPSCLGCGKNLVEMSRKAVKGGAESRPNFRVVYRCENDQCDQKKAKKSFLDDGLLFIPLPDK